MPTRANDARPATEGDRARDGDRAIDRAVGVVGVARARGVRPLMAFGVVGVRRLCARAFYVLEAPECPCVRV